MSNGRNRGGGKEVIGRVGRFNKSITMIKVMHKGYNILGIGIRGGVGISRRCRNIFTSMTKEVLVA